MNLGSLRYVLRFRSSYFHSVKPIIFDGAVLFSCTSHAGRSPNNSLACDCKLDLKLPSSQISEYPLWRRHPRPVATDQTELCSSSLMVVLSLTAAPE